MKYKGNGANQARIYKRLMTQENQLRAGQSLSCEMGKGQTGLTHVEVKTITIKDETTNKNDVEDACHDENRRTF